MISLLEAYRISLSADAHFHREYPLRQVCILFTFFLISLFLYVLLSVVAPPLGKPIGPFMVQWGVCFLFYFLACFWIMNTRPLSGRWYWGEIGIIFVGAIIFRVMLLHLPLGLSRDAWRYLWDARILLHGYSPYQYVPFDKVLIPLRNTVFAQTPYRSSLTPYPPVAELFFVLGYLLNPTHLIGLKSLFVLMDIVTCAAIMLLLYRKGCDPRFAIIYAWSPLSIIEFAIQGHIDAVPIAFTVLAVLSMTSSKRGIQVLAGVFVGLAALSKIYPIALMLVLVHPRDWKLLILCLFACIVTILAGYAPFLLLNNGHILNGNFLTAALGQSQEHLGILQNLLFGLGNVLHLNISTATLLVHIVEFVLGVPIVILVFIQRIRGRMSVEMSILILFATLLILYAHVFPWYATALLPWIALLMVPLWKEKGLNAKSLAVAMLWYFTSTIIISYNLASKSQDNPISWSIYYSVAFGVMVVGLVIAAVISLRSKPFSLSGAILRRNRKNI